MSECCFHTNIINERNPRDQDRQHRPISMLRRAHEWPRRIWRATRNARPVIPRKVFDARRNRAIRPCAVAPLGADDGCGRTRLIRPASIASRLARCLMYSLISGGLFRRAVGAAQATPIDVGAQVFAADGAAGGALDGRAVLGRNAAGAGRPLRQKHGDDAQ